MKDASGSADDDTEDDAALNAAAAVATEDPAALRAVELAAEAAGIDYGTFEKEVTKSRKKSKKADLNGQPDREDDMNKMMMSNKKRKLYERMKHGEKKREAEVRLAANAMASCLLVLFLQRANLESKKLTISKERKRLLKSTS
jgi:pescadillo protein